MKKLVLSVVLQLLFCASLFGQTVIYNPLRCQFDQPDFATVDNWRFEVSLQGASTPIATGTVAKTDVTTTGTTPAYEFLLARVSPPLALPTGQTYIARIFAVNAGGTSAASEPSNPFAYLAAPATPRVVSIR